MMALLFNILVGRLCWHKWKILSRNEVYEYGYKIGDKYHLQCEKCGNMKFPKTCSIIRSTGRMRTS